MKTDTEIEKEFKTKLKALLDEYHAEMYSEVDSDVYDTRVESYIMVDIIKPDKTYIYMNLGIRLD